MLTYPLEEAIELLSGKLATAKKSMVETVEDLEWLREQATVMEVNFARVHNVCGFDYSLDLVCCLPFIHSHLWLRGGLWLLSRTDLQWDVKRSVRDPVHNKRPCACSPRLPFELTNRRRDAKASGLLASNESEVEKE